MQQKFFSTLLAATIVVAALVTVGTFRWLKFNSPYIGNVADVEIRHIARLDFKTQNDSQFQSIFSGQFSCLQTTDLDLSCSHSLAGRPLTVEISARPQTNQILMSCTAEYDGQSLACLAHESVYIYGGASTPIAVIEDAILIGNENGSGNGNESESVSNSFLYSDLSIYNSIYWLRIGYWLLASMATILFGAWSWQRMQKRYPGQHGKIAFATAGSTVIVGIIVFIGAFVTLLSLHVLS